MMKHREHATDSFDFMQEHETSPVDLITRRYPQIVILKPYNTCSQICVYCQRNWEIDDVLTPNAMATKEKILRAVDWIRAHPTINEVLVTGGDPFVMPDDRLDWILSLIADIETVERIRIGSRTLVVLPQRITDKLVNIVSQYQKPGKREVAIVTHFEHPYEVTPEALVAAQKFKMNGISVYNQAVYTVENSRKFELVALRQKLRMIGVDPYYTFNTKGKEETKNYRVPMARLQQEIKEEARLVPGTVRTDEPVYNVPRLGKNYLRAAQHHTLITILPDGSRMYEFHPWEKNLALAQTYIDTDVPIYDYLKEIESRGENIEEYKSIWYYF
jgi:lysine 2,3-aminomutase